MLGKEFIYTILDYDIQSAMWLTAPQSPRRWPFSGLQPKSALFTASLAAGRL